MNQENPQQAILVIKGTREEVLHLRRQIVRDVLGRNTSNMIWYEDEISAWTPDLPDGFRRFDRLLTIALRGPKMQRLLEAAKARKNR